MPISSNIHMDIRVTEALDYKCAVKWQSKLDEQE